MFCGEWYVKDESCNESSVGGLILDGEVETF